jgi:hypothetical protein
MPKKKSKFDVITERAAAVLQEHFDSLPSEVAKEKSAEFHRLTIEMGRGSRSQGSLAIPGIFFHRCAASA